MNELTVEGSLTLPTIDTLTTSDTTPVLTGTASLSNAQELLVSVSGAQYRVVPGADDTWSLDLSTAQPISGVLPTLSAGTYDVQARITDGTISLLDTSVNELVISDSEINYTQPEVLIYISTNNFTTLNIGSSVTVNIKFNKAPVNFNLDMIDLENAELSNLQITSNPLVYEATLVPNNNLQGNVSATLLPSLKDELGESFNLVADFTPAIDTLAPESLTINYEDTGISDSDFITKNDRFSVSGLEPGGLWKYSTDNMITWSDWIESPITSINLVEGLYHNIHVLQKDDFNNESSITQLVNDDESTILIDKDAPIVTDVVVDYTYNNGILSGQVDIIFDQEIKLQGAISNNDFIIFNNNSRLISQLTSYDENNNRLKFNIDNIVIDPSQLPLKPTSLNLNSIEVTDIAGNNVITSLINSNYTYQVDTQILSIAIDNEYIGNTEDLILTNEFITNGERDIPFNFSSLNAQTGQKIKMTVTSEQNSLSETYIATINSDTSSINVSKDDLNRMGEGPISIKSEIINEDNTTVNNTEINRTFNLDFSPPVLKEISIDELKISENDDGWAGINVSDEENISFEIKSSDYFKINENTGLITYKNGPLNFESIENDGVIGIEVVATDIGGNRTEKTIEFKVLDIDETVPVFNQSNISVYNISIDEDTETVPFENDSILFDSSMYLSDKNDLQDDTTATVVYSIKQDAGDDEFFKIDAMTGQIRFSDINWVPDIESLDTQDVYQFTVIATDQGNNFAEQLITLNINDVVENNVIAGIPNFIGIESSVDNNEDLNSNFNESQVTVNVIENIDPSSFSYKLVLDSADFDITIEGTNSDLFNVEQDGKYATVRFKSQDYYDYETQKEIVESIDLKVKATNPNDVNKSKTLDLNFQLVDVEESGNNIEIGTSSNITIDNILIDDNTPELLQTVRFTVTFAEPVSVTGRPQIRLVDTQTSGENFNNNAIYSYQNPDNSIVFDWVVPRNLLLTNTYIELSDLIDSDLNFITNNNNEKIILKNVGHEIQQNLTLNTLIAELDTVEIIGNSLKLNYDKQVSISPGAVIELLDGSNVISTFTNTSSSSLITNSITFDFVDNISQSDFTNRGFGLKFVSDQLTTFDSSIGLDTGIFITNEMFISSVQPGAGEFINDSLGLMIYTESGETIANVNYDPMYQLPNISSYLPVNGDELLFVKIYDTNGLSENYLDEFTGKYKDLNFNTDTLGLRQAINIEEYNESNIKITPLSELIVRIYEGQKGPNTLNINQVRKEVFNIFSLNIDEVTRIEFSTDKKFSSNGGYNPNESYGLLLAAMSSMDNVTGSINETLEVILGVHESIEIDYLINETIKNIHNSSYVNIMKIAKDLESILLKFEYLSDYIKEQQNTNEYQDDSIGETVDINDFDNSEYPVNIYISDFENSEESEGKTSDESLILYVDEYDEQELFIDGVSVCCQDIKNTNYDAIKIENDGLINNSINIDIEIINVVNENEIYG